VLQVHLNAKKHSNTLQTGLQKIDAGLVFYNSSYFSEASQISDEEVACTATNHLSMQYASIRNIRPCPLFSGLRRVSDISRERQTHDRPINRAVNSAFHLHIFSLVVCESQKGQKGPSLKSGGCGSIATALNAVTIPTPV